MKKNLTFLALIACGVAAPSVQAAESAVLTVTGKITPQSCDVAITNGQVDFNTLQAENLQKDAPTLLEEKHISYTISCSAATPVATRWEDDRSGTAYGSDPDYFGLGKDDDDNPIGGYTLTHVPAQTTVDNGPATLWVGQNGKNWNSGDQVGNVVSPSGNQMYSYGGDGAIEPAGFQNYAGTVKMQVRIAPTNTLKLDSLIPLDGQATLSLEYL